MLKLQMMLLAVVLATTWECSSAWLVQAASESGVSSHHAHHNAGGVGGQSHAHSYVHFNGPVVGPAHPVIVEKKHVPHSHAVHGAHASHHAANHVAHPVHHAAHHVAHHPVNHVAHQPVHHAAHHVAHHPAHGAHHAAHTVHPVHTAHQTVHPVAHNVHHVAHHAIPVHQAFHPVHGHHASHPVAHGHHGHHGHHTVAHPHHAVHHAAHGVHHAPHGSHAAGHGVAIDYVAHPKYQYAYGVVDHKTGDTHSQKESRDGDVVVGEYALNEPGGNTRTVQYTADKDGFHAHVINSNGNDHSGAH